MGEGKGAGMKDSFQTLKTLSAAGKTYGYHDLTELERKGLAEVSRLPFSIRVMLESLLRNEDGYQVTQEDILALARWQPEPGEINVPLKLARVILQDFTGVPAVVDLAAMRDAVARRGGDPERINPVVPADLVIDHSVQVDAFGTAYAFFYNVEKEYERNRERYLLLKWGQQALKNFRVVPPGHGHRPPGEPGVPGPGGHDREAGRPHLSLPRQPGGHRQPHHHGERPGGLGLGRGRH
jgi:aconitate hydratase